MEEYIIKSSLFAMTSISEGLPMVLLEAMSYGVPCIAYETESGISDIIEDGVNGYIIKHRDEKEYIEKVNSIMESQRLRNELSAGAKKTANSFSKSKISKLWYDILK